MVVVKKRNKWKASQFCEVLWFSFTEIYTFLSPCLQN